MDIQNILTDGDYYDEVAALESKDEKMYEVAKSLVANGIRIIPCKPYNERVFNDPATDIKKRKEASGKAPFIKSCYSNTCGDLDGVDEWFNPIHGQYRGQNIGIATGEESDLIVVDIDNSDEVNGWDAINELLAEHGHITTTKVRSGGKSTDGQHWYFRYREGLTTCSSKIKGVDIRTNKGHVMAPLCTCQGTYEVVDFSEVAEMPDWLFEALTAGRHTKVADKAREEHREHPDAPLLLIQDALEYMPIENFDGVGLWLKIAMCIHSEHPDEGGYHLLDLWSSGALGDEGCPSSYDEKGNRLRWDSFGREENNLTIGTLFHVAKTGELDGYKVGGGWVDPRSSGELIGHGQAVMMMRKSFVQVNPSAWRSKMRRRGIDTSNFEAPVSRVPAGTLYSTGVPLERDNYKFDGVRERPEEVRHEQVADLSAHFIVHMGKDPRGKDIFKTAYQVWRSSPAKEVVRGVGYYVSKDRCPKGVLNMFTGWGVEPKPGVPEMFIKHLREIICDGDDEKYSWVINRMACVVQRGEENLGSALVINGAEGLGKGLFWMYITRMAGAANCHYTTDPETFTGRFTGEELDGKFFVNADEALFSGDIKADGKAKGLVGNQTMRNEGKGKATKQSQNVSFFIFFSNHADPVHLTRGNRRFCIMTGNDKYAHSKTEGNPEVKKEADSHFKKLAEEMESDGPAKLLHLLLNHKIDFEFARSGLMTAEKAQMVERQDMKRDSLAEWVMNVYITEPDDEHGNWDNETKAGETYGRYNEWVKANKHNHPSRGWTALDITAFKRALCGIKDDDPHFGFEARRKRDGNYYKWPTRDRLRNLLMERYPNAMSEFEAGHYDPNSETEF